MGTIANAKVTHYYNCYNGDFIGCLLIARMPYMQKATNDELLQMLPHKWKKE